MPPRLAAMAAGGSSLSAAQSTSADRGDQATDVELEEVDVDTLYLQPPSFKRKDKGKWQASGKGVAFALSPISGEIASWIAPKVCWLLH